MRRVMRWGWTNAGWLGFFALLAFVLVANATKTPAKGANGQTGFPVGGTAYAQGYNRDQQTVYFRHGLTVADSNSISVTLAAAQAATPVEVFGLFGKPTVSVSARFSTSSSNTCVVRVVWLYSTDGGTTCYVLGSSDPLTLTATTLQDAANPATATGAGYFVAPDRFFDGHGATHALIVLTTAPTGGGSVDLWVGSY